MSAPGRRTRGIAFIIVAVLVSTVTSLGVVLALDLYLHRKFSAMSGLNVWGYRGPVVGAKRPGERRVVVLGGSTAFGYALTWDQALPALLERKLNERRPRAPVSVVNLGYNNEGAYAFPFNLADYAYLAYDVVVLYTGYNDLGANNRTVVRHGSPVFRLTGYLPVFPMIFREKAMALRHGGDLAAAYGGGRGGAPQTVFTPTAVARGAALGLETAVRIADSLEGQLGRLTDVARVERQTGEASGAGRWDAYCRDIGAAVEYALARGARVVVAGQPYISDRHVEQQQALERMLRERFPRVVSVNLGRVIDLRDRALTLDGMHLTVAGNERLAESLVAPVLSVLP